MNSPVLQTEIISKVLNISDETVLQEMLEYCGNLSESTIQKNADLKADIIFEINCFVSKMNDIKNNISTIEKLQETNETIAIELLEMLRLNIQDWEPIINEKAVCISLLNMKAWHLWYIEKYPDGMLRFKEAPKGYLPNNFCRVSLKDKIEVPDHYVIPKMMFETLNEHLNFSLLPDRYEPFIKKSLTPDPLF